MRQTQTLTSTTTLRDVSNTSNLNQLDFVFASKEDATEFYNENFVKQKRPLQISNPKPSLASQMIGKKPAVGIKLKQNNQQEQKIKTVLNEFQNDESKLKAEIEQLTQ